MRQAATRELLAYWNRLRDRRPVPDRADIDLSAMRGSLKDLFLLDVDAAHQFPFVMAGSRLNAYFCAEHMGRSFLTLWRTHDARSMAAALMTVVDTSCPIVAAAQAHPEGYRDAEIEFLFLPLSYGGLARRRILGLATPAVQPPWVGLLPAPHFGLRALRAIEVESSWIGGPADAPLAAAQQMVTNQPTNIRGHLRVFEGGK